MKHLFTLILCSAVTLVFSQCADTNNICKFSYLGKNYEIVKERKSWVDASACAVERGGYLVSIEDSSEQLKVYDEISNGAQISSTYTRVIDGGGIAYVWIGATDKTTEGDWVWDNNNSGTGQKFWTGDNSGSASAGSYNNWGGTSKSDQKEPDNFGIGQDMAAIGLNGWPATTTRNGIAGEWNDIQGSNTLYYVIEYDSVKAPIDTTTKDTTTSINETGRNEFSPYPNPATERIFIDSDKPLNAYIMNLEGKIVGRFENNELDVSELKTGTYWVRIEENFSSFKYPIVIQ